MFSLVSCQLVVLQAECRWTLEVRLHHYSNPTSQRSDGTCCDTGGSSNCSNPCDNVFHFCLRPNGSSPCSYGRYDTDLVAGGDNLTFTNGTSAVPNPLLFNGIQWPTNVSKLVFKSNKICHTCRMKLNSLLLFMMMMMVSHVVIH